MAKGKTKPVLKPAGEELDEPPLWANWLTQIAPFWTSWCILGRQ